jgi:hypothetical protein
LRASGALVVKEAAPAQQWILTSVDHKLAYRLSPATAP